MSRTPCIKKEDEDEAEIYGDGFQSAVSYTVRHNRLAGELRRARDRIRSRYKSLASRFASRHKAHAEPTYLYKHPP
jgi:hypothetical protein